MTKVELSEVLRAHTSWYRFLHPSGLECACDTPLVGTDQVLAHADHLADVVLAWVAKRAGDAAVRHDVADAIVHVHGGSHDRTDSGGDDWRIEGDAALTAFVGTLAGSGAPAGVEVAPHE